MDQRRLPVGIQTFREIREEGYYYVDKTTWAHRLENDAGKHYFRPGRPRRLGLVQAPPVVRLDFSSGDFADADELHRNLMQQFDIIEREHGMESGYDTPRGRFLEVLREMHHRTGRRVVVLYASV